MKYAFSQFKDRLPSLTWDKQTLADKLSLIGHETEIYGETLDVTLTSNRKDCKDLNYLLFDLAGVYGLELTDPPTGFGHGPEILVNAEKVNKLLGSNIKQLELKDLERLGFIVTDAGVQPPDFRDVATAADVAEEVFRLIGCDALALKPLSEQAAPESAEFTRLQSIKFALVSLGWTETATNSFSSSGEIELKNPFTDTEPFLRPTLRNGLLQTLAKNPFMKRAKFFEIGDVFGTDETAKLGLITSGYKDMSDLSNALNETFGETITFAPISVGDAAQLEAKQGNIMFAEISVANLHALRPGTATAPLPKFKPISKYPPLIRDVTILGTQTAAEKIIHRTDSQFPQLLIAEIIDQYTNPETTSSSVTIRFIFQKMDGSFTQEEIDTITTQLDDFLK